MAKKTIPLSDAPVQSRRKKIIPYTMVMSIHS